MGTFSEMAMAGNAESEREEIQPFSLETTESESPVDGNAPAEDIEDDARQQAEADAAAEALAKMTEEKELTPAQKKKEHEEAEAKRKAEWEAKHAAKQEAELMHGKLLWPSVMKNWHPSPSNGQAPIRNG